jgi:hypothetical protein
MSMASQPKFTDEEIVEYLRENGSPPHIVRGGRAGLIERWQKFVSEVDEGYRFGLEDYRNDLDLRGIIETLDLAGDEATRNADQHLAALLTPAAKRLWESCDGNPFWDFGYPKNAGEELLADLQREGLVAHEDP